jgi:hypothetical protein
MRRCLIPDVKGLGEMEAPKLRREDGVIQDMRQVQGSEELEL